MGGGNPIKRVEKAIGTASSQITEEVGRTSTRLSKESTRIGEQATKAGTAALEAVQDPGLWLGYAVDPTTGIVLGAKKAKETYEAMSQAEKDEYKAKAEAAMAKEQERKAMAEQEKMIADKAKAAADQAKERAVRMGQGRRGLLYQTTGAQGVTSKSPVLGG